MFGQLFRIGARYVTQVTQSIRVTPPTASQVLGNLRGIRCNCTDGFVPQIDYAKLNQEVEKYKKWAKANDIQLTNYQIEDYTVAMVMRQVASQAKKPPPVFPEVHESRMQADIRYSDTTPK